ncbi:uncharacterized protein [Chironomus tepperi]|uniref:uncharacterized protein n=1 Tax=Chironomus tepperi TaxID=113505 RepID=UPI00391F55DC
MMNLGTVAEVLDKLQTFLDNYSIENLTTITIDWEDEGVVIIEWNSERSIILIQKDFFESKNDFLRELIYNIKKNSLLNIHASIKVCDLMLPNDCPLYETKSCDTLYEKVCEYTGLKKIMIFELLMPVYEAQLYFFARPGNLDERLARFLFTSGSNNSAAVNTLYVEMINASEHLENISFIGKVNSSDHQILKKIVDFAVRNLVDLLNKPICPEDSTESKQMGVIDLTTGLSNEDEDGEKSEHETFYDINTSEIMESDLPLSHYYDPDIKGLVEGWDERTDSKNNNYDEKIMSKFLDCVLQKEIDKPRPVWDENPESADEPDVVVVGKLKRSKSDEDIQFVSAVSVPDSLGKFNLTQRKNDKVKHLSTKRMTLGGYKATTKIKSNLFNDDEVVKWEKSKKVDGMSTLMSSFKDYKDLGCLDKDYKIPRKSYNGPSSRPSIHNSSMESKINKQEPKKLSIFQNRIDSLVTYNSPSAYRLTERSTPQSVSNFIDIETINVTDDEENDNNNNHSTRDKVLQKGPAKRKLLPLSPKMFKNRRTDYKNFDSPFSSNFSKNSSHRKL